MKQSFHARIFSLFFFLLTSGLTMAQGAELDPEYQKQFGWASIMASGKGLPQKAKFDITQFDIREKALFVQGGDASATIDIRVLLPEGETYESLLARLKKENPAGSTAEADESVWLIWFSHSLDGTPKDQSWPASATLAPLPSGNPDVLFHTCLEENMLKWNTVGLSWYQLGVASPIDDWLKQAKPGYRLFVAHTVGFLHPPTEGGANASADQSLVQQSGGEHNPTLTLAIAPPPVKAILTVAEKK